MDIILGKVVVVVTVVAFGSVEKLELLRELIVSRSYIHTYTYSLFIHYNMLLIYGTFFS